MLKSHSFVDYYYSNLSYYKNVLFSKIVITPLKARSATPSPRSSTCCIPKVKSLLHNYILLIFSTFGTRERASAMLFSRPLICSMSNVNYGRNSNHLAFLLDTVALICI